MYKSVIFTVLGAIFLSVPVASLPLNQSLDKRSNSGKGTWYRDGLGACGHNNVDSDLIVAISAQIYGSGGYCGRYVDVTNTANGQSAYAEVVDECQSCGPNDLDLSVGMFQAIGGDLNAGVLSITWDWMPVGWTP